jgi:hypothetical protein
MQRVEMLMRMIRVMGTRNVETNKKFGIIQQGRNAEDLERKMGFDISIKLIFLYIPACLNK